MVRVSGKLLIFAKMKLKVIYRPVDELVPYAQNARTHSDAQIEQIAESIREFGFNNPVLVDEYRTIIAGHGRVLAAQRLGMTEVPTIELSHLSDRQRKAYILADNQIAMNSGWDFEMLATELASLAEQDFDLDKIGFSEQELDALLKDDAAILPDSWDDPSGIQSHADDKPVQASPAAEPSKPKSSSKLVHKCPNCGTEFHS